MTSVKGEDGKVDEEELSRGNLHTWGAHGLWRRDPLGGIQLGLPRTYLTSTSKPGARSSGGSSDNQNEEERGRFPRTIHGVCRQFATSTSLQGLSFIERAGRWWSRLFWILAVIGAFAAAIFQSYEIVATYLAYGTISSVTLSYGILDFPSVTLCNLNPVRFSRIHLGGENFEEFVESLAPETEYSEGEQQPGQNVNATGNARVRRSTDEFPPESSFRPDPVRFGSGNTSSAATSNDLFQFLLSRNDSKTRRLMGHQKETMIIKCEYNGLECDASNFVHNLNHQYGNCYTFNSAQERNVSLASFRSGVRHGLNLELYTDEREYLHGYTVGKGFRVVMHPFSSMAFPSESGISVSPGSETFIGLRLISQQRLGLPYKRCDDDGQFTEVYQSRYRIEDCVHTCLDRSIAENCGCYRQEYSTVYPDHQRNRLRNCYVTTNLTECMMSHEEMWSSGQLTCSCRPGCTDDTYNLEISTNSWPDRSYWYQIVNRICQLDDDSCEYLKENEATQDLFLRQNFANIRIFYRTLNYETIQEAPSYERSQFLADFGGTIGLWVGASFITAIEVVDFIGQLIHFKYKQRHRRKKNATQSEGMKEPEDKYNHTDIHRVTSHVRAGQWRFPAKMSAVDPRYDSFTSPFFR